MNLFRLAIRESFRKQVAEDAMTCCASLRLDWVTMTRPAISDHCVSKGATRARRARAGDASISILSRNSQCGEAL